MTELRALTGMRGIAAWLVVLYHIRLSIAGLPTGIRDFLAKGYLAVDFFFLLSGFVIWLSWHDRLRTEGWAAVPGFLRKRIARIWPLHLTMLGVAVALVALLAATGRAPDHAPLAELPVNILLVQNWGFTDRLTWNDPAWSISAELAAYLLFPVLAMSINWRRWSTPALVGVAILVLGTLHWAMRDQSTLGQDIPRFGVVRCLAEFTTGGIVCALWQRRPDDGLAPVAMLTLLAAVWRCGAPETLVVPAAFAAALLAIARTAGRPGHPLEGRAIHYLGEISYATYLSHFILWRIFKLAFVTDPSAVPPALIAAYLLLVLAASAALYHGIERPAQRWITQWRWRRTPARAAVSD